MNIKQKRFKWIRWVLVGFIIFFICVIIKNYTLSEDSKRGDAQLVSVLFAKCDIDAGEGFRECDLVIRKLPERYAHRRMVPQAMQDFLLSQIALVSIKKGDPILWDHLNLEENKPFSDYIGVSERAISIRVDELNSIQGLIQPSDKIDIMTLVQPQDPDAEPSLKIIAQNITVLLVDGSSNPIVGAIHSSHSGIIPTTLTLKVNPTQAAIIAYAQTQGRLLLSLRNRHDHFLVDIDPVNAANLQELQDATISPIKPQVIKDCNEQKSIPTVDLFEETE